MTCFDHIYGLVRSVLTEHIDDTIDRLLDDDNAAGAELLDEQREGIEAGVLDALRVSCRQASPKLFDELMPEAAE